MMSFVILSWTDYVWSLVSVLLRISVEILLMFSALLIAVVVAVVFAALAAGNREKRRSK